MLDLNRLHAGELLALGRRSLELLACRLRTIADASDPDDRPLQDLLQAIALEKEIEAADVESRENETAEESRLSSWVRDAERWIAAHLTSLFRPLGEGPMHRDIALFLAESLEEEEGRLFRVLSEHARETRTARLFLALSERERGAVRHLREVILQG